MKLKLRLINIVLGGMYNVMWVQFLCWFDMYLLLRWYLLYWKFGGVYWWIIGC